MSEYTPAGKLVYLAAGGSVSNDGKTQARVYGNGVPAIEVQHGWVVSPPEFALLYAPLQVRAENMPCGHLACFWIPCSNLFQRGGSRQRSPRARSAMCCPLQDLCQGETANLRDPKWLRQQLSAAQHLSPCSSASRSNTKTEQRTL